MTNSEKLSAIQALIDGRFDDTDLLKIGDLWTGPDSFKINVQEIINRPEDEETSFAGWNVSDVLQIAEEDNGVVLTEEQAVGVLELMIRKADSSLGISHDTISYWVGVYLENFKKS